PVGSDLTIVASPSGSGARYDHPIASGERDAAILADKGGKRVAHRFCDGLLARIADRERSRSRSDEGALGGLGIIEDDRQLDLVVVNGRQAGCPKRLVEFPGFRQGKDPTLLHASGGKRGK